MKQVLNSEKGKMRPEFRTNSHTQNFQDLYFLLRKIIRRVSSRRREIIGMRLILRLKKESPLSRIKTHEARKRKQKSKIDEVISTHLQRQ